jgi:hypothetical protein
MMSLYLATTAVRTGSVEDVTAGISAVLLGHGIQHEVLPEDPESTHARDVFVCAPRNGWVVVRWPDVCAAHDFPMARRLAKQLDALVSTVHVLDDTLWEHLAVLREEVLHAFCSAPELYGDEDRERVEMFESLPHGPGALAQAAGVEPAALRPYLQRGAHPTRKAHEDDASPLGDCRVFVDFWRRLGVTYVEPPAHVARVRLASGFDRRLPRG